MSKPRAKAKVGDTGELFISHTASDLVFARALDEAITTLVGGRGQLPVEYSTNQTTGPQGGERWREWIYTRVVQARTTLVVVTPHAMSKPWLLWEAGACWGASLAQHAADPAAGNPPLGRRSVISIAYGLGEQECPDPLRGEQIVRGNDEAAMRALFTRLLGDHDLDRGTLVASGGRMDGVLETYLAKVEDALLRSPSLVNESNVQDWLERLATLQREQKWSELPGYLRWMTLAFGRDVGPEADVGQQSIDVRLHRRLGEILLGQTDFAAAVQQLRLAWRLAPRDIYVLRPLAEASMKQLLGTSTAADHPLRSELEYQLRSIEELDPQNFRRMPESAALYAKYLRRVKGDPAQALAVLSGGLEANPDSYYLADLVAQTQLGLGRVDDARSSWRTALDIIERVKDWSLWVHATAATACLALGRLDAAREHLAALQALPTAPTPNQLQSIEGGLVGVASSLKVPQEELDRVLQALHAPRQRSTD